MGSVIRVRVIPWALIVRRCFTEWKVHEFLEFPEHIERKIILAQAPADSVTSVDHLYYDQ